MPPAGAPRPDEATYERRPRSSRPSSIAPGRATPLSAGSRRASSEPHRVSERHPRPARARRAAARGERRSAAAARQHQQRLRQHRRSAVRVAEHDGALPRRRAEDQPSGRRRSGDAGDGEHPYDRAEHPQDERVDDLPFGTRGGIAIRSDFPVDGDVRVERRAGRAAVASPISSKSRSTASACGSRRSAGGWCVPAAGRWPRGGAGVREVREHLEFPLPLKAGHETPRRHVRPAHRGARRGDAAPEDAEPRHAAGDRARHDQRAVRRDRPGDSPSRRRIFVCAARPRTRRRARRSARFSPRSHAARTDGRSATTTCRT